MGSLSGTEDLGVHELAEVGSVSEEDGATPRGSHDVICRLFFQRLKRIPFDVTRDWWELS